MRARLGDTGCRGSSDRSGGGNLHPTREGRHSGIGRFHFAGQASEAPGPGLADTFQLGTHLSAAHGREADADPLLSHWNDPSVR